MSNLPCNLQKPRAILFDLDGTLASLHKYSFMKLRSFLSSKGHELPRNLVEAYQAASKQYLFHDYQGLLHCPGEDEFAVVCFKTNKDFMEWMDDHQTNLDGLDDYIPASLVGAYVPLNRGGS